MCKIRELYANSYLEVKSYAYLVTPIYAKHA
jgi:hypothetical protein